MGEEKILVTAGWPYVNVTPHIGNMIGSHLSADVVARYYRLKGDNVIMVSGSDEHGTPVEVESIRTGTTPKELTDRLHTKVTDLLKAWGISYDNYTRTENPIHKKFVSEILMEIYNRGYIFEHDTTMLYCDECERFLPDRFVEGKCPYCNYEHARGDQCEMCGRLMETTLLVEPYCAICKSTPVAKHTKHWYFDLPKLSSQLASYLKGNKQLTANVRNFSLNLVQEGLKPRSVTRDVAWGIPAPFPGAEGKTIYVWIEAVLGYITAVVEYFQKTSNPSKWKDYWFDKEAKTYFFIAKDNIPFHTIIFPALLLASGENFNLPWNVSATEFLQIKGEKASKSQKKGVFIDEALRLFPPDYWRYFLLASRPETKDSNFSWELFKDRINADLNDSYGNFVHRTLTFIYNQLGGVITDLAKVASHEKEILDMIYEKASQTGLEIEECRLQAATATMMSIARLGNQYLNEKEPWNLIKKDRAQTELVLSITSNIVKTLAVVSAPFVPFTAEEIWKTMNLPGSVHDQRWSEASISLPPSHKIGKPRPLFRKVDAKEEELEELLLKARSGTTVTNDRS